MKLLRQPIEHRISSLVNFYALAQLALANIKIRNTDLARAHNLGSSKKIDHQGSSSWQAQSQQGSDNSFSSGSSGWGGLVFMAIFTVARAIERTAHSANNVVHFPLEGLQVAMGV